jgi:hypothetical protein
MAKAKKKHQQNSSSADPQVEIVVSGSILEIVKAYEKADAMIRSAYDKLHKAEDIMRRAFNVGEEEKYEFGSVPGPWKNSTDRAKSQIKFVRLVLKKKAWRALYDRLEVEQIMSIKRRDKIFKDLDEGKLPELTVKNVVQSFRGLYQNINQYAKESVLEVYEWLRPSAERHEVRKYKTNQGNQFELGKKIIKLLMVEQKIFQDRWEVNSYNEKYLIALDKVFHLLDGKSMLSASSYRSPVVDAINTTPVNRYYVETEYFRCKMYKNGNLHIEFLRTDLVQKFNAIAAGVVLKPGKES